MVSSLRNPWNGGADGLSSSESVAVGDENNGAGAGCPVDAEHPADYDY